MPHARRSTPKNWWIVLPTAVILLAALALTSTSQAAPGAETQTLAPQPQEQELPCQGCHPEEHTAWQGSSHASAAGGVNGSLAAGVTCEACHGKYKEGHPKAETMQLPMESTTCRTCHATEFMQWESSQHAEARIDCYDCHQAHTQGLRLGSVEKLCSACHTDEQTEAAHSIHGISGVDCTSCHMSELMIDAANLTDGAKAPLSNHTFAVASDVCTRCHTGAAHKSTGSSQSGGQAGSASQSASATGAAIASPATLATEQQSQRVDELELQLNDAEKRITDLRNIAVVSMGLSLGVGGALGLLVGIGVTALLNRRKSE